MNTLGKSRRDGLKTLAEYENIVESSIATAKSAATEAGSALITIRDERLWEETGHSGFEVYFRSRFKFSLTSAFKYIEMAEVKGSIEDSPHTEKIQNHGQVKALSVIPEPERKKVLNEAASRGDLSPAAIKAVAAEIVSQPSPPKPPPKKKSEPKECDSTGYPIPDGVMDLWTRRFELKEIMLKLSEIKCRVEKSQKESDPLFSGITPSTMIADIEKIRQTFKWEVPYAVCPYCQGVTKDKCRVCRGKGMIGEHAYQVNVPEELKAIRLKGCKEVK
jgi:hypothetical protein